MIAGATQPLYTAVLNNVTDYYAFGAPMPGRNYTSTGYRYGFNGKENDNGIQVEGVGDQDYGLRIYNPSLGRFLSVDPLTASYPWNSPYAFSENRVIDDVDLEGGEYLSYIYKQTKEGFILISKTDYTETKETYGKYGPGILMTVYDMNGKKHEQFMKTAPLKSRFMTLLDPTNSIGKISKYLQKAENAVNKIDPQGPIARALRHFDQWVNTEPESNGNMSDQHNDMKGDGKSNAQESPDNPYVDPLDPSVKKKNVIKINTVESNTIEVVPKEKQALKDSIEYRYVSKYGPDQKPIEYKVVTVADKNDVTDTNSPNFKGSVKYEKVKKSRIL